MQEFCRNKGVFLCDICQFCGLCKSEIYRWQRDKAEALPEISFSLPAPREPLELDFGDRSEQGDLTQTTALEGKLADMRRDIKQLSHGAQRSKEASAIHEKYGTLFSRREIDHEIHKARKEANRVQKESYTRIKWRMPMVCMAFDDTWVYTKENGSKIYIHNIKDLSSQYLLPPMAGKLLTGAEVAKNLEEIFIEYGAPLFLKRDNGSNLNSKEVNEVLARFKVIPLNSPAYYSRYNGSTEQSNHWIKEQLKDVARRVNCPVNDDTVLALARLAAHEENIKQRRVLNYSRAVKRFWLKESERDYLKKSERSYLRELIEERECKLLEEAVIERQEKGLTVTEKRKKKIKRTAVEEILRERGYIEVVETSESVSTY